MGRDFFRGDTSELSIWCQILGVKFCYILEWHRMYKRRRQLRISPPAMSICRPFNTRSCGWTNYNYVPECSGCEADHPAVRCFRNQDYNENDRSENINSTKISFICNKKQIVLIFPAPQIIIYYLNIVVILGILTSPILEMTIF
jgi:hypothetical protein